MIYHLDQAALVSADPPEAPHIQATHHVHTGRPGRPRIEIDPDLLATALQMRGPTGIAPVLGVSSRTVRRRALEYGLVEPGPPVYTEHQAEDGSIQRTYTSSTQAMSDISDDELDMIILHIVNTFPDLGRRMISGHLRSLGYHISPNRQRESYNRVHGGPSASVFGNRRIERRVYSVPGPNSLWHHDGQHGMVKFLPLRTDLISHL